MIEVDLDERPWEPRAEPMAETSVTRGLEQVDWTRLIGHARDVTSLPEHEPLTSRRRHAVKTRLLIAIVATRDLGQTYASVAARLGMRTGSVFNLLARKGSEGHVEASLAELRRRLAAA